MAVEWRHLIFGDVDSADYGIYISGDGVYNAPERAVEFVDVPGRNGAIALDQGRYNNITVTYPAGTFAKTQEEFRESLSAFRNAILSQKGYQRLEDTYHPDEYRMGLYSSGLEVSPVAYNKAGEFELVFNCKPQRWLTVGELPIPVDSGDVLQNPTPFDAGPLLEVVGYGDVSFNGYTVSLDNTLLGETQLIDAFNQSGTFIPQTLSNIATKTFEIDGNLFNIGDTITVNPSIFATEVRASGRHIYPYSISGSGASEGDAVIPSTGIRNDSYDLQVVFDEIEFTAGTSSTKTYTATTIAKDYDSDAELATVTLQGTIAYTYADGQHEIQFYCKSTTTAGVYPPRGAIINAGRTIVDSTLSLLGNPTYIDCDLGEAYKYVDGSPVSLNSKVALGSDLPVLAPGSNKITFDNTITDLKIAPRWWRI